MSKKNRPYRSSGKSLPVLDGMRVAKIRNSYFIPESNNPNGFHHYIIYHDKRRGQNCAILTTHLYYRDKSRFNSLRRGEGIKISLPGFEAPTMVKKKVYEHDGEGRPIDFANGNIIVKGRLNRSKSKRIWQFLYSMKKV